MSIDWHTDPTLADFVHRARAGEHVIDQTDIEADKQEARKAKNREASRLSHQRKRRRSRMGE